MHAFINAAGNNFHGILKLLAHISTGCPLKLEPASPTGMLQLAGDTLADADPVAEADAVVPLAVA